MVTSPASKVAARKATRQERRKKPRLSHRYCTTTAAAIPKPRSPKRRKLNDHASERDERCSKNSEQQRSPPDPVGLVGTRPSSEGRLLFSISKVRAEVPVAEDRSSRSEDITAAFVACDEPFPRIAGSESRTLASNESMLEQRTRRGTVVYRPHETHSGPNIDGFHSASSSLHPSLPTTPNATPRIKCPGQYFPSPILKTAAEYSPGYLNAVEIPSPFLYHSLSQDYVPPTPNVHLGWNVPYLEYAIGRTHPEPDFTSYRPMPVDRRESLGFALCAASSSQHRAEASQISTESHDSSDDGCPLSRSRDYSGRGGTATDSQSCRDLAHVLVGDQDSIIVDPEWSWAEDILRLSRLRHIEAEPFPVFFGMDDNLIIPTAPNPACIGVALVPNCVVDDTVPLGADPTSRLWDGSMRTISAPCGAHNPFTTVSLGAGARGSTSACLELVPDRLYRHQFTPWPPMSLTATAFTPGLPSFQQGQACNDPGKAPDTRDTPSWFAPQTEATQSAARPPPDQHLEEVGSQHGEDASLSKSKSIMSHNAPSQGQSVDSEGEIITATDHSLDVEHLGDDESDDDGDLWYWDSDFEDSKNGTSQDLCNEAETSVAAPTSEPVVTCEELLWPVLM